MTHDPILQALLELLEGFRLALLKPRVIKMDERIQKASDRHNLNQQQRAILYAKTMDNIRYWGWAEQAIAHFFTQKCPKPLLNLMHAALIDVHLRGKEMNPWMNTIKLQQAHYAKLAYGVLKNSVRNPLPMQQILPEWMKQALDMTPQQEARLLQAWEETPNFIFLRFPDKNHAEEFCKRHVTLEKTEQGVWIQACKLSELPGYHEGWFYVQDAHAALVDNWLKTQKGTLWDACAAPGGKTFAAMHFDLKIDASDTDLKRLDRMQENLIRLKPEKMPHLFVWDARKVPAKTYDAILLDVPCSGSGVFSKHPEGRWQLQATRLQELVTTQHEMLTACWQALKPEGEMLYMTCSVFADENQKQIKRFLAEHPDAHIEDMPLPNSEAVSHGSLLMPTPGRSGGFYFARLKKKPHA